MIREAKRLCLVLFPLLLLLAVATPAGAADPVALDLQAPEQVNLGEEVSVTAVLRSSSGAPIPAATITLWSLANFLSVGGWVELGQSTTDAQGRATFLYQARSEAALTLNATFSGDSRYEPARGSLEVKVLGSAQLYREEAGVQMDGIGLWFLVGILGGVWSIYLVVMVLITLIAREGSEAPLEAGGSDA